MSFLVNIQTKADEIEVIRQDKWSILKPSITVQKLKFIICIERDMSEEAKFDLIYNGQKMDVNKSLKDYGINDSQNLIKMVIIVNKSPEYKDNDRKESGDEMDKLIVLNAHESMLLSKLNHEIQIRQQALNDLYNIKQGNFSDGISDIDTHAAKLIEIIKERQKSMKKKYPKILQNIGDEYKDKETELKTSVKKLQKTLDECMEIAKQKTFSKILNNNIIKTDEISTKINDILNKYQFKNSAKVSTKAKIICLETVFKDTLKVCYTIETGNQTLIEAKNDFNAESMITNIPLSVIKYKGYYSNYSPKNLLVNNQSLYGSITTKQFKYNEPDWIIFKMSKAFIPIYVNIKGDGSIHKQDPKYFTIGLSKVNSDDEKDFKDISGKIEAHHSKNIQQFKLDMSTVLGVIGSDKNWLYVRLALLENNGYFESGCKFVLQRFFLEGYQM